jgi:hypothetical protein
MWHDYLVRCGVTAKYTNIRGTNSQATAEELFEAVFSMRSVRRLYSEQKRNKIMWMSIFVAQEKATSDMNSRRGFNLVMDKFTTVHATKLPL